MMKTMKSLVVALVFGLAMAAGSAAAGDNPSPWKPSGTVNYKHTVGAKVTALSVNWGGGGSTYSINDTVNTWHYANAWCVAGATTTTVWSGWVFGAAPAWAISTCPFGYSNTWGHTSIWT